MKEISFGTLRLRIAPTVYEPAEDSFLLATYASSLVGKPQQGISPPPPPGIRVLEMGCGSGIVSLSAALANRNNDVTGVDVNPEAVKCSQENAEINGISNAHFFISDLFAGISGKFDVILFNPPYLPTTRKEKLALEDENAAYDGGKSGLKTFYRFSHEAPSHLFLGGKVAVIATSLNDGIKKTLSQLESRVGPSQMLATESFFFEKLALIEAVKK